MFVAAYLGAGLRWSSHYNIFGFCLLKGSWSADPPPLLYQSHFQHVGNQRQGGSRNNSSSSVTPLSQYKFNRRQARHEHWASLSLVSLLMFVLFKHCLLLKPDQENNSVSSGGRRKTGNATIKKVTTDGTASAHVQRSTCRRVNRLNLTATMLILTCFCQDTDRIWTQVLWPRLHRPCFVPWGTVMLEEKRANVKLLPQALKKHNIVHNVLFCWSVKNVLHWR